MFILSDMLGIPQDIVSDISSSNQNGIFMIHLSLKVNLMLALLVVILLLTLKSIKSNTLNILYLIDNSV